MTTLANSWKLRSAVLILISVSALPDKSLVPRISSPKGIKGQNRLSRQWDDLSGLLKALNKTL